MYVDQVWRIHHTDELARALREAAERPMSTGLLVFETDLLNARGRG